MAWRQRHHPTTAGQPDKALGMAVGATAVVSRDDLGLGTITTGNEAWPIEPATAGLTIALCARYGLP
jgi:hypothetical protein